MSTPITPLTTDLSEDAISCATRVVEDYMDEERSFTSLDIANAVKAEGHFARNKWVAQWLRTNAVEIAHDLTALYNQTLITVSISDSVRTLAYLYHHMNVDPADYLDRSQKPLQTVGRHRTVPTGLSRAATVAADLTSQPPSVKVVAQHDDAVSQHKAVQRDIYGRFTNNPSAKVAKPTHFLSQHRDNKGRFVK